MFNLSNEKPARLEGALIENLFIRDMLAPSFKNISSGWWFTVPENSSRKVAIKLAMNPEQFCEADFVVAKKLASIDLIRNVIFVCPFRDGFGWVNYADIDQSSIKASWESTAKDLSLKKESKIEELTKLDHARIQESINLLSENGILDEVQMERFFASNYLNELSWDMDAYVVVDGEVTGFEVKQKYPTRGGTFGINVGLLKIFDMHAKAGIPVWHIILTKPVRHKDFSATKLITDPMFAEKSCWIGTPINVAAIGKTDVRISAAYTSLYKNMELKFHDIPCSDFFLIKRYTEATNQLWIQKLLRGECQRLRSDRDIPVVTASV